MFTLIETHADCGMDLQEILRMGGGVGGGGKAAPAKVQERKEEAINAFVIFSSNLLQDMFTGIVSSQTLPPVTKHMQTVCGWGAGLFRLVLETIFFRTFTLCM
jgi:hypothetical protein